MLWEFLTFKFQVLLCYVLFCQTARGGCGVWVEILVVRNLSVLFPQGGKRVGSNCPGRGGASCALASPPTLHRQMHCHVRSCVPFPVKRPQRTHSAEFFFVALLCPTCLCLPFIVVSVLPSTLPSKVHEDQVLSITASSVPGTE